MSFQNAVLEEIVELGSGEVVQSAPNSTSAYEVFEDGLVSGRFCKFDAGQVDNLDGSATPVIAGIPRRKVTGEIATASVYSTTGEEIDSAAEVINFGYATVDVVTGLTPAKYEAVNVINDGTADAGKATNAAIAAGIISAGDVVFWESKSADVWLVRINKYL